uniref:Peptidase S8/S53 domain-containing protein n=1 Tax=Oryza rufipogon TaxID=4529 RepID=A0A0E0P4S2_ORYRU
MKRPSCKQLMTPYTMVSIFENAGSFHAVKNGITVVFAAGNSGPAHRTGQSLFYELDDKDDNRYKVYESRLDVPDPTD